MVPLDNAASNPPGREPEFIPGGNPAADAGQAKHPPDTAAGVQETGKGEPENEEPGGNNSETPPAPEPENDPTPYDSAWRTIIVKTPELLIPFINEVFGTDYSANAQVILTPNEHFMARQDGETRKRITDSSVILREQILSGDALEIRDDVKTGHYLTEVEAKPSNERVLIRIFEYAVQVGADVTSQSPQSCPSGEPDVKSLRNAGCSPAASLKNLPQVSHLQKGSVCAP